MWAPRSAAPARTYPLGSGSGSAADVVGVHALPAPNTYIVAHFDGTLQRVELDRTAKSTAHYMHPRGGTSSPSNIRALAGHEDSFLAASEGVARLYRSRAPWVPPTEIDLGAGVRAWSAALTESTAFVGVSGGIGTYALHSSGPVRVRNLQGPEKGSAAYAVAPGPQILSAWYDGAARLHDPRTGSAPVLELSDPWSDVAFYSAAFVGEYGVAAGGAQHGTVSVWDVRNPGGGWSVFSPAGRGSPVYALAGDGGRVWGVTERRAFVLAFDGSGDVEGGIVTHDGRGARPGTKDVPTGYGRRGGKFRWTVHYGDHAAREVSMGYRHGDRGMSLFETEVPA
jgi:WD40 repeat protein